MSVIYSALVPHSPLLLKPIGKDNTKILQATLDSYKTIIEKIKNKNIETILIIGAHGEKYDNYFALNNNLNYKVDMTDFGDLATKLEIEPDLALAQKIQDSIHTKDLIKTYQKEKLDYGSAIPLYIIGSELKNVKALNIKNSNSDEQTNLEFGKKLKHVLKKIDTNIAIIVSGDMSHCLNKKSPRGYNPKGVKFDNQIKEILSQNNETEKKLLNIDNNIIKKAEECSFKPLLIALGIMSDYNYKTKLLSYQDDFGIGYLSVDFDNLEPIIK